MCPNGKPGGTNFGAAFGDGMPKKPDSPASGHAGMAGMPPSLVKRQGGLLGVLTPKMSVFIGQGDEGTATSFFAKDSSVKTGYFIGTKDTFSMLAEVVNYEKKEQEVYVTIDYEYIPNVPSRTKEWLEVGMGALTVTPCGSQNLRKCSENWPTFLCSALPPILTIPPQVLQLIAQNDTHHLPGTSSQTAT